MTMLPNGMPPERGGTARDRGRNGVGRPSFAHHRLDLRESRLRKAFRLIAELEKGVLLDIGCGDGAFAVQFLPLGWTVMGVEAEEAAVERARARKISAHVHDVEGSRLPFGDGTVDCVFAGEVIEHLIDTDHFLGECRRVLRPGGRLVLTTPNLASLENRLRLLFGRYPMWMDHSLAGTGHLRYYTPRILTAQLGLHGFVVERHLGNWVPIVPQRWLDDRGAPWLTFIGDLLPSLAMGIIVRARRGDGPIP